MDNAIQYANPAVINYVRTPFIILVAVFAVITIATAGFVIHEIKKQKNDTE